MKKLIVNVLKAQTGEELDLVTIAENGQVTYVTGKAESVMKGLAKPFGDDRKGYLDFLLAGWSNGYVTLEPAIPLDEPDDEGIQAGAEFITLRAWLEAKHPRDWKGRFRETPDAPNLPRNRGRGRRAAPEPTNPRKKRTPEPPEDTWEQNLIEQRAELRKSFESMEDMLQGKVVLTKAGASLSDRDPSTKYDTHATLTFKDDPGWTQKQMEAHARVLRLYRNSTFKPINNYLRDDSESTSIWIREKRSEPGQMEDLNLHIALMDEVLEEAPITEDIELWRGIQDGPGIFGDQWEGDLVGKSWDELGFVSASADMQTARGFAGTDGAVLRLRIPKGLGGVKLSGWASKEMPSSEAEMLLQRRLQMRVVEDIPGSGGYELVDGEWVDTGPLVYRTLVIDVVPLDDDEEEE